MTMPYGSTEEPDVTLTEPVSVPVHVVSSDARPTKALAPEYGRWRTFLITSALGNDLAVPGARRIAPRSLRRKRLHIIVSSSGGTGGQVTPANPAAGTSYIYTNNTGVSQQVIGIEGLLTTSVAVLNRFISATVKDASGNFIWTAVNGSATPASSTIRWNGYQGASQQNSATGTWTFPIPANLPIPPGGTLTLGAGALDAADQISGIVLNFASQASTDGVIVGGREEIAALQSSNNPITGYTPGGYIQAGASVRYEAQQELWVAYPPSNAGPVIVTVCDEVYASDPQAGVER